MELFRNLPAITQRHPCGLAIGNFDGVHLGHQAMLAELVKWSQEAHLPVCVLTFEPHPREFFAGQGRGQAPARVCNERDKLDALAKHGVDRVCIAQFDQALAATSADQFVTDVICDGLQAKRLLIGDDFRFGAKRTGDFDRLQHWADQGKFELRRMQTKSQDGVRVSSSAVRAALAEGDFAAVRRLLGRSYTISGHVVHGRKLGRTLGFPTLNLRLPFPRPALAGIFVVQVRGLDAQALPAVASIGTRPAVETNGAFLLEVHLLDFNRDVYGELVQVEFLQKLRDETHFDSLDLLKDQIDLDAQQAREFFAV